MGAIEDAFATGIADMNAALSPLVKEQEQEIEEHPYEAAFNYGLDAVFLAAAFSSGGIAAAAPMAFGMVTGALGDKASRKLVAYAAPNHPNLAGMAGFAGGMIAFMAGDRLAGTKLIERFGIENVKAMAEDIEKELPEETQQLLKDVRTFGKGKITPAGAKKATVEEAAQMPERHVPWKAVSELGMRDVKEGEPGFSDEPKYEHYATDTLRRRVFRDSEGKPVVAVNYRIDENGVKNIDLFYADQSRGDLGRAAASIRLLKSFIGEDVRSKGIYSPATKRMLTFIARYKKMDNIKEALDKGESILFPKLAPEEIDPEDVVPVVDRTPTLKVGDIPRAEVPVSEHEATMRRIDEILSSDTVEEAIQAASRPLELSPEAEVPPPAAPPPPSGGEPPPPGEPPEPPGGGEPPESPDDESKKQAGIRAAQEEIANRERNTQGEMFPDLPTSRQITNRVYDIARDQLEAASNDEVDQKLAYTKGLWPISKTIYSQFVNAVLWNPAIWAGKAITDLAFQPFEMAFRTIGMGLRFGPTAAARTVEAALHGWAEAGTDAFKYAARTFEEERPVYKMDVLKIRDRSSFGIEALPNPADNLMQNHPLLGRAYQMLGAFAKLNKAGKLIVMSLDQFAEVFAERANMHMMAYQEGRYAAEELGLSKAGQDAYARTFGKWLVAHPTDALKQKVIQKTLEWTFAADGPIISTLNKLANSNLGARIALPFVKTPGNLIHQGIAHSPFAFATDGAKILGYGAENGVEQLEAIAKWGVGATLGYIIWNKAAKGEIYGHKPPGRKGQFWPGTKTPESIKIGKEYYSYARFGPFATMLSLMADSVSTYEMSKDPNAQTRLTDALISGLAQQVGDSGFMRANSNMMRLLGDAENEGGIKSTKEYIGRELQGFIWSPVRQIAELHDPGEPVTTITGPEGAAMNPFMKDAKEVWLQFANGIPGYNDNRLHDMDTWGNEIYRPPMMRDGELATWWTRAANELTPVDFEGKVTEDPVEQELFKHHVTFNDDYTALYGKDPRFQVPIPENQQAEYHQLAGKGIFQGYGDDPTDQHSAMFYMMQQDWYKMMNKDDQANALRTLHESYKTQAKDAMIEKYGYDDAIVQAMTAKHAPAGDEDKTPLPTMHPLYAPSPFGPGSAATPEPDINSVYGPSSAGGKP